MELSDRYAINSCLRAETLRKAGSLSVIALAAVDRPTYRNEFHGRVLLNYKFNPNFKTLVREQVP